MRKRLLTSSIWLGLFAMLMIHVGPLYSALQMAQADAAPQVQQYSSSHDDHLHHAHPQRGHSAEPQPSQQSHHGHHRSTPGQPEWLVALEMCGYCELLTINPPLAVAIQLLLPRYQPQQVHILPDAPLRQPPHQRHRYARGPPGHFHS